MCAGCLHAQATGVLFNSRCTLPVSCICAFQIALGGDVLTLYTRSCVG